MKRAIKFRVWDSSQNKMYYDDFVVYPNGTGVEFPEGGWDLHGRPDKDCVLMQYTGLIDGNNQKERYEGDILRFWGGTGTIVYRDLDAGFKISHTDGEYFDISPMDITLGNIYEDKHLLNLKKRDYDN